MTLLSPRISLLVSLALAGLLLPGCFVRQLHDQAAAKLECPAKQVRMAGVSDHRIVSSGCERWVVARCQEKSLAACKFDAVHPHADTDENEDEDLFSALSMLQQPKPPRYVRGAGESDSESEGSGGRAWWLVIVWY